MSSLEEQVVQVVPSETPESRASEMIDNPLEKRLETLLQQTDLLLRGNKQTEQKKPKKGSKAGHARGRLNEAEEDSEMLQETFREADGDVPVRLLRQPSCITGEMRDYQLEGLNWLIGLYDKGISGILADEMGLGKTLQSISLMGYLKEARGNKGPHLIISPKSTLSNWLRECARWCPSLTATKLIGDENERKEAFHEFSEGAFDVLITSYEMVVKEKSALKKVKWDHIIIDMGGLIPEHERKGRLPFLQGPPAPYELIAR